MEISKLPFWTKLLIAVILDILSLIPIVEYIIAPVSFYFLYKTTGMPLLSLVAGIEDLLPAPLDILPDNTAVVLYYEYFA